MWGPNTCGGDQPGRPNPPQPLSGPLSLQEDFKPLTRWMKKLLVLGQPIERVRVSQRLTSRPCVVMANKVGGYERTGVVCGAVGGVSGGPVGASRGPDRSRGRLGTR